MTTPPVFCASSSASADLPLAVGPAISTALLTVLANSPACPSSPRSSAIPPTPRSIHHRRRRAGRAALARPRAMAVRRSGGRYPLRQAEADDIKAIEARLRQARGDLPIDIVVQPAAFRRKKLFLADMDSTMIGQECIDELADFAGLKAHVAAITERAMRGEIEFEPALRERVALLKDLPVGVVDEVLEKRITLTPGGRELVATMRAHGAWTCLISGGFTLFTNAVAAKIGFQENRANELKVARRQTHRRSHRADSGPRHQTRDPDRTARILRSRRDRHAGDRRRRQRSRHDRGGGPRRRLSRQARGRGRRRRADRLRRSHARCSMRRAIGATSLWRGRLSTSSPANAGTHNPRRWLRAVVERISQTTAAAYGSLLKAGDDGSRNSPTARSAPRSAVRRRRWRPAAGPTSCRPS